MVARQTGVGASRGQTALKGRHSRTALCRFMISTVVHPSSTSHVPGPKGASRWAVWTAPGKTAMEVPARGPAVTIDPPAIGSAGCASGSRQCGPSRLPHVHRSRRRCGCHFCGCPASQRHRIACPRRPPGTLPSCAAPPPAQVSFLIPCRMVGPEPENSLQAQSRNLDH